MKTLKKIGKKLLNNWALKLFSLMAAFVLWLVVMNIDDPEEQWTVYNIPVKLSNTDVVTNEDMVYEVLDKTDVVRSVTITAPKSVKDELSSSDIVAEADFNNLTVTNTVEIRFYSLRYNDKIADITGSNEILKLNIEEKRMKRLVLGVQTTGEVAEGYIVNSVTPNQNRVEITGPASVVSRIAEASVKVDVTDSTGDISTNADVILYDVNGQKIATDKLDMNISSALVKVEILATKSVPVICTVSGSPAEGYLFTGEISGIPKRVTVAGTAETLESVKRIVIPETLLDITGYEENLITDINIEDYLPEGIILADESVNGKLQVMAHVEKEYEKTLNIAAHNISITGVPDGYKVALAGETILYAVKVKGLHADVEAVDLNTLNCTIDMTAFATEKQWEDWVPGVYEATVQITLPEKIVVEEPIKAYIEITESEEN